MEKKAVVQARLYKAAVARRTGSPSAARRSAIVQGQARRRAGVAPGLDAAVAFDAAAADRIAAAVVTRPFGPFLAEDRPSRRRSAGNQHQQRGDDADAQHFVRTFHVPLLWL